MVKFYFKYKGLHLAGVWADDEQSAKELALIQHAWCGVEYSSELTLIRVNGEGYINNYV